MVPTSIIGTNCGPSQNGENILKILENENANPADWRFRNALKQ
jgi:hypothetical protein